MKVSVFIGIILLLIAGKALGQETVFSLLEPDLKRADKYYSKKNYRDALSLYKAISRKKPSPEIELKIARSYLFLKNYKQAIVAYERYGVDNKLPAADVYNYAEAQSGISNYDKAIQSYQDYLQRVPEDPLIMKKIWRLNNLQYLYEDSLHYAVRPVQFNTTEGELCAVPYKDGVVFMSNRKQVQVIEKVDGSLHTGFYKMYYSKAVADTSQTGLTHITPVPFDKNINSRFHVGPPSFFDNHNKLIFTSTENKPGQDGIRTLQLYFAEKRQEGWEITSSFPFNSSEYSLSDPAISEDGSVLYLSSDMKGGHGGKDIYRSEFKNGQWSKPENLGLAVNTSKDEVFPYLHYHTLYFASNGHAGLGGLDIFKTEITPRGFDEPQNVGYPLNTNYDDFGIVIDSLNTHGFFSSNRKKGGYNDDIFEFDMDLQTYPLDINGLMRYKEHELNDSIDLQVMPNAKIYLIDNVRNITIQETASDINGNFSITIPYLSKYKLRVIGEDQEENIVSLEIPKHRKADTRHEIVIVKDIFKSH
jgi:tetratricopeptide (TPR) repeat protein